VTSAPKTTTDQNWSKVTADVEPATRQISTRKSSVFGNPYRLTLLDELGRR
jgi:hypothetical protein